VPASIEEIENEEEEEEETESDYSLGSQEDESEE
jgi:hypothetical protein